MVAAALTLLLVACGDDTDGASPPSAEAIEDAVVDRLGADAEQARCVRERFEADFSDEELRIVVDEGMPGLPQARWGPYLDSTVTCLTLDPDER